MKTTGEMNWQLRQAREKRMWSMAKAAEKCGVDTQTYFRWEAGKQRIRLSSLEMLCAAFGEPSEHLGFGAGIAGRREDEIREDEEEQVAKLNLSTEAFAPSSELIKAGGTMALFDPTKRKTFEKLAAALGVVVTPQVLMGTNADSKLWATIFAPKIIEQQTPLQTPQVLHFVDLWITCWTLSSSQH